MPEEPPELAGGAMYLGHLVAIPITFDTAREDAPSQADVRQCPEPTFESANSNVLRGDERRDVLDAVDRTCGDTWCEGDVNFSFTSLACSFDSGTCNLLINALPQADGGGDASGVSRVCTTGNFQDIGSLLLPDGSGLTRNYYDALEACMSDITMEITSPRHGHPGRQEDNGEPR